jgi:hypothetical protein
MTHHGEAGALRDKSCEKQGIMVAELVSLASKVES